MRTDPRGVTKYERGGTRVFLFIIPYTIFFFFVFFLLVFIIIWLDGWRNKIDE